MAGKGEAADLGRAPIEHVEKAPVRPASRESVRRGRVAGHDGEERDSRTRSPSSSSAIDSFVAVFPFFCRVSRGVAGPGSSSAMSPPQLKNGSNSFRARRTSRSSAPGSARPQVDGSGLTGVGAEVRSLPRQGACDRSAIPRPRHKGHSENAVSRGPTASLPPRHRRRRGDICPCQCRCSGVSVSL